MEEQRSKELVKCVRDMKRHMAGKAFRGAWASELTEPNVRSVRDPAQTMQSHFAELAGVNLRLPTEN